MSDRDTDEARANLNETARRFRDTARRAGNTGYTHADAVERVKRAKRLGEMKRNNNNR